MSVDSDRDSVIESEDGKEEVIRSFSVHSICLVSTKREISLYFIYFICFSIQMMTLIRRRMKITAILRRYARPLFT